MSEWVNVKDRLPEDWASVLMWAPGDDNEPAVGWYGNGRWHGWGGTEGVVTTYWMPLPEPPKESE